MAYRDELKRTHEIKTAAPMLDAIENSCHYVLDQTWDEDRCRMALGQPLRSGYGPENTSRLRRFAISLLNLHAKPNESIASMTRKLAAKTRLVFD